MLMHNSEKQWGLVSRAFHGIGVLLIAFLLAHGWWMVTYAAR